MTALDDPSVCPAGGNFLGCPISSQSYQVGILRLYDNYVKFNCNIAAHVDSHIALCYHGIPLTGALPGKSPTKKVDALVSLESLHRGGVYECFTLESCIITSTAGTQSYHFK